MVLDASLLNTQHYKVRIKSKLVQSGERSSAPLHHCVVAIENVQLYAIKWKGNSCIHTFSKGIRAMQIANSYVQDLNSGRWANFLW